MRIKIIYVARVVTAGGVADVIRQKDVELKFIGIF